MPVPRKLRQAEETADPPFMGKTSQEQQEKNPGVTQGTRISSELPQLMSGFFTMKI